MTAKAALMFRSWGIAPSQATEMLLATGLTTAPLLSHQEVAASIWCDVVSYSSSEINFTPDLRLTAWCWSANQALQAECQSIGKCNTDPTYRLGTLPLAINRSSQCSASSQTAREARGVFVSNTCHCITL